MSVQAPEAPLGPVGAQAGEAVAHVKPATAERPAGAIRAASSHLGKKLTLFPATGRINPLSQPEEPPCGPDAAALAASEPGARPCEPALPVPWGELPAGVLERVLLHVRRAADAETGCGAAARRARLALLYGPYSVCRAWRAAGLHALFSNWWAGGQLSHPSQCLYTTPAVFPQLLRCYIVRQRGRAGGQASFRLFQGSGPEAADARFLMSAQLGRAGCQLCLAPQAERLPAAKRLPAARLRSGLLRCAYSLELGRYGAEQLGLAPGSQGCRQATIGYQTRILSCLRPRRMAVALSGSNAAPHHARPWPEAACSGEQQQQQQPQQQQQQQPGSGAALCPRSQRDACQAAAGALRKRDAILARQGRPCELQNKEPRWNEGLRCWCLNFKGRVKFASVKNFQLAAADDPDHVLLQFGKASASVYILDFQPASLSAAQAFAVALSSFRPGLL